MSPREFNPLRLDVEAFAQAGAELRGEWALADTPRLLHSVLAPTPAAPGEPIRWSVRGERRRAAGASAQTWLHLEVQARVRLECQRCLSPVEVALEIDRPFRFVAEEAQAAALDAEMEEDVLVTSRALDLREWVEDELLLALPIVPRHGTCPQALTAGAPAEPELAERPHPFAALAALKKPDRAH